MDSVETSKAVEEGLKQEEVKRRKREGVVILIATLMVLVLPPLTWA